MNKYKNYFTNFESLKTINDTDVLYDDENSLFPREARAFISEGGLSHLVPKSLGGKFENIYQIFTLGRILSKHNVTSAIAVGQSFLGSIPVWLVGSSEAKLALSHNLLSGKANCLALTEKDHGSDLGASEVYLQDEKLYGEKWCINNATIGQSMTVIYRDKSHGQEEGEGPLNLVFFNKNSNDHTFSNLEKIKTHGIRGADISGIQFNGTKIEPKYILGRENKALEIISKTMQLSRTLCASFSLGAGERVFNDTVDFCQNRILYGKNIMELKSVDALLSKSLSYLYVSEAISLVAVRMTCLFPELMSLYASVVKVIVPHYITKQMALCNEVMGARYYLREDQFPLVQKFKRDHEVVSLFDGSQGVNLSLLYPVLRKLKNILNSSIDNDSFISLVDFFNFESSTTNSWPEFKFEGLKIGIKNFDYILTQFVREKKELSKYFTYNLILERLNDLSEIDYIAIEATSFDNRKYALEFTKILSLISFMMFHCFNEKISLLKMNQVDEIIISLLDEEEALHLGSLVHNHYRWLVD